MKGSKNRRLNRRCPLTLTLSLKREGEKGLSGNEQLGEVVVEHDGYKDGGEDEERVAECEAEDRARRIFEFAGHHEVVLMNYSLRLGGFERDHGVAAAPWADAYLYPEDGQSIEKGECECYGCRQPQVGLENARECEDKGNRPEDGLGLEAPVCGPVFVSDVEAVCAEFFHQGQDNGWVRD